MAKKFLLVFILVSLCILTYNFCYFIAETYFFDKFFYDKDVRHGYQSYDTKVPLSAFGKRAIGVNIVKNYPNQPITQSSTSGKFKIAIIGDSYLWGQGLRNEQRFAALLEDNLNNTRPTEVISFAYPGWNILDLLSTYQKMLHVYKPDLIIFSLVNNDAFINKSDTLNPIVVDCMSQYKSLIPTFTFDSQDFTNDSNLPIEERSYYKATLASWNNPVNLCILDHSLSQVPTDNTLYYLPDNYLPNSDFFTPYIDHLNKNQKKILTSERGKDMAKYSKYWADDPWKHFLISPGEEHPNALANQMYADVLYREITSNPKWGFKK